MGKTYGYCRISTQTQSLERQERNIKTIYPDAIVLKEAYTGRSLERPIWQKLYKILNDGDTVVFDEVSRMSRDADEGFALYKELYAKGVNLVFLKESHINTDVYKESLAKSIDITGTDEIIDAILEGVNNGLMLMVQQQFKLAFDEAQKEVDFLSQRTKEGIETARLAGKQIGGKVGSIYEIKGKDEIKKIIRKKSKMFEGRNSDSEVIAIINSTKYFDNQGIEQVYHVSSNTYYKYKKELKYDKNEVCKC